MFLYREEEEKKKGGGRDREGERSLTGWRGGVCCARACGVPCACADEAPVLTSAVVGIQVTGLKKG